MDESLTREGGQIAGAVRTVIKTTFSTDISEDQSMAQVKETATERNCAENTSEESWFPYAEPDGIHTSVGNTDSAQEFQDSRLRLQNGDEDQENCNSSLKSALEPLQQTNTSLGDLAKQQDCESKCRSAAPQTLCDDEKEVMRRAQDEGRVDVVFAGSITQDGCRRFVCELLKFILYQRQQLPMTYDQMVSFHKQHSSMQPEDGAVRKPPGKTSESVTWQRCQRTLQDLDEVFGHLEELFSLTRVPRVLFMLGGSPVLPNELYEVNMEALVMGSGDRSLRTSSCLRQLFRTLFVADLLSEIKAVRLVPTTVMALGHRDCGMTWFKPKLNFKVPTRVKRRVISLSSDPLVSGLSKMSSEDLGDYIWFQAPVTVKGFQAPVTVS